MNTRQAYEAFLAAIDVTIAGTDEYGDLRWHVECTAVSNANDCNLSGEHWYKMALDTAEQAYDDWKSYYPQLIKNNA